MTSDTTVGHINLGKRPDLMLLLERYEIIPKGDPEGPFAGCSKKWSEEKEPPYDQAVYQAMADRLPEGWEDITREEMDRLIDELKERVEKKRQEPLSRENLGNRFLLDKFLIVALLGIFTTAAVIEKSKFAWIPNKEEGDLKAAERFAYTLLLQLATESNVVQEILRTIGASTGLNAALQEVLMEGMELFGILVAVKIASMKEMNYGITLIDQFQEEILRGIVKAQQILLEAQQKEMLAGSIPNGVALFLQQGKMALEKGDFEGFYQTYQGALGILGITDEQFSQDLESIREFAERLVYACTEGRDDLTNTMTGISQA